MGQLLSATTPGFLCLDRNSVHAMKPEMIGTSRNEITAVASPSRVCLIYCEVKSATIQGDC
jgi:hypothetical protein